MEPRIWWVESNPNRLAIVARPQNDEDLPKYFQRLRREHIGLLVSLLTTLEMQELELNREADACADAEIAFRSIPIVDRSVPENRGQFQESIVSLVTELQSNKSVAIHCRAGIGRSALVAACVLIAWKQVAPDAAFRSIAKARGCPVPDTDGQRDWVNSFFKNLPR